jgi:hypothetical protein
MNLPTIGLCEYKTIWPNWRQNSDLSDFALCIDTINRNLAETTTLVSQQIARGLSLSRFDDIFPHCRERTRNCRLAEANFSCHLASRFGACR